MYFFSHKDTLDRINSLTVLLSRHLPYSVPPAGYWLTDCARNKMDKIWLEVPLHCLGDRGGRIHGVTMGIHIFPAGQRGLFAP